MKRIVVIQGNHKESNGNAEITSIFQPGNSCIKL